MPGGLELLGGEGDRAARLGPEGAHPSATGASSPPEGQSARSTLGERGLARGVGKDSNGGDEVSERLEKYYTSEQQEYLERRPRGRQQRIREAEAEWSELMEQVRAEMEAGTDPADGRQWLARRWMELVEEFTGGDAGIARSVGNMRQQEEAIHGIDTGEMREMMAYIQEAMAAPNRTE